MIFKILNFQQQQKKRHKSNRKNRSTKMRNLKNTIKIDFILCFVSSNEE